MKRNPQSIEEKIRKIIKKTDLLKKKRDTFGLDEDEHKQYRELTSQFFTLHDELLDEKFDEWLMVDLYNNEALNQLAQIKKYIPWNGGKVTREDQLEEILDAALLLNEEQKEEIEESLNRLHEIVFKALETACENDDYYEFVETIGVCIACGEYGDIRDVVNYIDDRYRDFAELLELELEELEVDWV